MYHDAMFYEVKNDKVLCKLCPHNCLIPNNKYGLCRVRINIDNELKTINYGEITSIAVDPIEKKPLYHFYPGKNIVSIGTFGCNFTCDFCQNYTIAQEEANSRYITFDQINEILNKYENNIGIAFTYNEPTIWYEFIYETAKKLKESSPSIKIVLVTNGFIQEEPLLKLLPYVDAMNIDLKSFNELYYNKVCGGSLEHVLKTIETSYDKCHIEVTTLIVSELNDKLDEIEEIAKFLSNLDKNIPLHLSRYYPAYKSKQPPTSIELMNNAKDVANKYLNYVYLGNMKSDTSTYCPNCNELLIRRLNYNSEVLFDENTCPKCEKKVSILN